MGAVEITLVSFIAVVASLAAPCAAAFLFGKSNNC